MSKSKKENIGMLFVGIGFLFSMFGMTMLTENGNLSLISSIFGVLIIVYGLFRIFKANIVNGKKDQEH